MNDPIITLEEVKTINLNKTIIKIEHGMTPEINKSTITRKESSTIN